MKIKNFLKLDFDNHRIFGLDLLRMLAIIFVVFSHSASLLPESLYNFIDLFYFDGVCIFFVLSGFLIGNILINSIEKRSFNRSELFTFWIRRWFRTLPNYYLFLFLLAILSKIIIKGFSLKYIFPYLYFGQNLFTLKTPFFGESWSLCVEEWFYLTIPIMLFVLVNWLNIKFKKSIIILSLFLLLFSTFLRYYMYNNGQLLEMQDYRRVVIMRIDNLMYGVIGAYISFYYKDFWIKNKYQFFIIGILLLLTWKILSYQYPSIQSFFYVNVFYPLFCIAILFLLPILSQYKLKKHSVMTKAITYISLISYSLYLIHYSLIKKLLIDNLLFTSFDKNSILTIILKNSFYWSSSIIGSLIIYKYFEIPTMKLRDKIKFK